MTYVTAKINPQEYSNILQLKTEGYSTARLASLYSVSQGTIYRVLRDCNWVSAKPKANDFTDEQKNDCISRFLNGQSLRSIARFYNSTHHHIGNIINGAGIKTDVRTKAGASRLKISLPELQQMKIDFESGTSITSLAEKFKIDRHTAKRYLKLAECEIDLRKNCIDEDQVVEFYLNCRSSEKTGLHFKISAWSVIEIVKRVHGQLPEREVEKHINDDGYIYWYDSSSPHASNSGAVLEHRYVLGEAIGRPLESHESPHHKNGNRQDNSLENLELWSKSQPPGQRVEDKMKWVYEMLDLYGEDFPRDSLGN